MNKLSNLKILELVLKHTSIGENTEQILINLKEGLN